MLAETDRWHEAGFPRCARWCGRVAFCLVDGVAHCVECADAVLAGETPEAPLSVELAAEDRGWRPVTIRPPMLSMNSPELRERRQLWQATLHWALHTVCAGGPDAEGGYRCRPHDAGNGRVTCDECGNSAAVADLQPRKGTGS